VSGMFESAEL